jgi:hypothetical protein
MNNAAYEEISEGFRLAKSERAVPGGAEAKDYATPSLRIEDVVLLCDCSRFIDQNQS